MKKPQIKNFKYPVALPDDDEDEISDAEISEKFEKHYEYMKHAKENKQEDTEQPAFEYHSSNPALTKFVIQNLPDEIKTIAEQYNDIRERDVFVTSMLILFSGSLNTVKGIYNRKEYHANLYAFIIAPPASGKSALIDARTSFRLLHNKIVKRSKYELAEHYDKAKKTDNKKDDNIKPPFKMLFIPANITTSKLYHIIDDCEGAGIIVETEADILAKMLKHEVGDTSSVLRCSFQNEPLTLSRMSEDRYIEIERPKIAVLLSGTPKQVPGIINSHENGLFSRFIFYSYYKKPKWNNVFQDKDINRFPSLLRACSNNIMNMIEDLNKQEITVTLTEKQKSNHNAHFTKKLEEITCFSSEDASSILFRIGLIAFKIMMILTAIRKHEKQIAENELVCSDANFKMALELADIYIEHSLAMFKTLPKGNSDLIDNKKMRQFLEILPSGSSFGRSLAIDFAKRNNLHISEKTVFNYLSRLIEYGFIVKDKFNQYLKTDKKTK